MSAQRIKALKQTRVKTPLGHEGIEVVMISKRQGKKISTVCIAFIALLCFHSNASTQIPTIELATNLDPDEIIIITEEKSTVSLRHELRVLDLEIYRLLNSLIEDDYYNINCNFPLLTQSFIRIRFCDTGYGEIASHYAYREASVMEVFDQLPDELLPDADILIMTELERGDKEYREIVFNLANETPPLAEKLLRRHYLQLVLNHRRQNWWNNVFGREVQPLSIPASEIQFPSK